MDFMMKNAMYNRVILGNLKVILVFLLLTARMHAQLPIERVASVNFQVQDLAIARAFYGGALGLSEAFDLKDANGEITAAYFKINDDQYLEFSLNPAGPKFLFVNASFLTHDLKGLEEGLKNLGLSPGKALRGPDGDLHVQLKDPMGNLLEFVQYGNGSQQMEHRNKDTATEKLSTHLLHVGLAEDNEVAAFAFYRDKLGFSEFMHGGPVVDHPYWSTMHMPVESKDYIELMLNTAETASRRDHISFDVPDIHKAHDFLVSRGLSVHEPNVSMNHRWVMNVYDPYGIRVEILGEVSTEPLAHPAN